MSTRSGRLRQSAVDLSPPRTRKGVSPPRSPARKRKNSPADKQLSPARAIRKSPARKSPSRKASQFPARKSPSRTTKETSEAVTQKSPAKRAPLKAGVQVRLDDLTDKLEFYRSTRNRRSDYSIKDISSIIPRKELSLPDTLNGIDSNDVYGLRNRKPVEEVVPRRSSRLRDTLDNDVNIRRSLSKSTNTSLSKSISKSVNTYSDEENSEEELKNNRSKSGTRKLATPLRGSISKLAQMSSKWEFGGRVGSTAFILLIPLVVFSVLIPCTKSCSSKTLSNLAPFKSQDVWFNVSSLSIVLAQIVLQAILGLVPILGVRADKLDDSGIKYCFNALFASIVTVTILFTLDFLKLGDSNTILNNYLSLAATSYIAGVILSIILYVKSSKSDESDLNPYGNTGYKIYDYFLGREVHPQIKKLDVKVWVSRFCNITTLVLLVLIFKHGLHLPTKGIETVSLSNYNELVNKVQIKPTILLFSLLQLIYILNFIVKEHKVTTTFFWQYEGVGYLQIVSSALYPFFFTSISKYVADAQLSLSTNILIVASVLYVVGFCLMVVSNNIKHEFRSNPLHPSLANLDSMPTFHGKKLLVSNLWGFLRHPNYTGDILIHVALALPGIVSQQYVAAAPALVTILILLHRAWRDHARCSRRYGAAWQRYSKKVPSVIIPKVL